MDVEAEIGKLKDAVIVMSAMLLRHEDVRKQHDEEINGMRGFLRELTASHVNTQRQLGELTGTVASLTDTAVNLAGIVDQISKKLAENAIQLAETTGKLDALIDVVGSLVKRERPPDA